MKIACIMMQKNEDLLIEPWILHHAYLFGFENIFIYDNGSSSPVAIEVLSRYQQVGVNVIWDKDTPSDFNRKGWIIGDLIKSLQLSGQYDFYIPLDCDELLALAGDSGLTVSQNAILSYFSSQIEQTKILRVTRCLLNVPGSIDVFAILGHKKAILPARQFKSLDHGFHEGELTTGKDAVQTDIVYIHLHNKPFASMLQSAKDKLAPFVDVEDVEALRNYSGVGKHLIRYFFDFEPIYRNSLDRFVRLKFGGVKALIQAFRLKEFEQRWAAGLPNAQPNVEFGEFTTAAAYASCHASISRTDAPLLLDCYAHEYVTRKNPIEFLRQAGYKAMSDRNWEQALKFWEEFSQFAENDPDGYAMRVCALRELKRFSEAESLAKDALERFPSHYSLFLHWALIVFPTRNWAEGRTRFAEMRRRFPNQKEGFVRGIAIERELKDSDAAQAIFAIAAQRFPSEPSMA